MLSLSLSVVMCLFFKLRIKAVVEMPLVFLANQKCIYNTVFYKLLFPLHYLFNFELINLLLHPN